MKVWKQLLGVALCLCMALCVIGVRGDAAEAKHSHDSCGVANCTNANHGHSQVTEWIELTPTDVSDGTLTLEAGKSYYLGETIETTKEITVNGTVNLCLNGETLESTNTVITVFGGGVLNICDCKGGGGKITNTSESNSLIKVDPDYKGTATLNLYGGKVSGSVNSDGAVMLYNNAGDQKDNAAIFNMYGGEVCNTGSGIYVSYSLVGTGFFGVNIYGGTVASENTYGIDSSGSSNATVLVAGGEVKGNFYAIQAIGNLKLSGSPLIHADEDEADIGIITASASTLNDYITVADDFAPANEMTISVYKYIDGTGSVRIAEPEAGKSLDGKVQYFVSADEGYFVESKNGELYLTACAITEEPAVGNGYTVRANGSPTYQWYSTTKGDVPVTSKNATASDDYYYNESSTKWYTTYSASSTEPVNLEAFTLHMNAGDVLKLTNAREVEGFSIAVSDGTPTNLEESPQEFYTYTYTAPASGEYTLTVTATPLSYEDYDGEIYYHLDASFTAKVTAYVPGNQLEGQTAATLNTTGLSGGSYICRVTWEGNTTLNSQVVRYTVPHEHDWATEWSSDGTHHWHECQNADCDVTDVSQKEGYGTHTEDDPVIENKVDATCTADGSYDEVVYCATCRAQLSRTAKTIDATGHDPVSHEAKAPTCTEIGWNAYVTCSRCNYTTYAELPASGHDWADATCTEPRTCSVCRITDGEALGHDWGAWFVSTPATTERYGTAARTCRRDPSHTETRLIPKLAPEPSEGCKKDGDCPLAAYPDLAATAWYHDGIHYCLENGLMQGVPGGAFQPGGDTTRAQLVTILWRQEGCPAVKGEIGFRDVRDGAWYADAVRWAAVEGIMRGYDGRFAPDDTVSREQMVTVLYRYAKYKGADVNADGGADISGFADGAAVSRYAGPAMEWACGNGLVSGVPQDGGTVLAPKDTTTRAQMAVLMMRFYTELMK